MLFNNCLSVNVKFAELYHISTVFNFRTLHKHEFIILHFTNTYNNYYTYHFKAYHMSNIEYAVRFIDP